MSYKRHLLTDVESGWEIGLLFIIIRDCREIAKNT